MLVKVGPLHSVTDSNAHLIQRPSQLHPDTVFANNLVTPSSVEVAYNINHHGAGDAQQLRLLTALAEEFNSKDY